MGEALITRRGWSIKTGFVANIEEKTMQDDALIGARNAIITASITRFNAADLGMTEWYDHLDPSGIMGLYTGNAYTVINIVIVDGVVTETNMVGRNSGNDMYCRLLNGSSAFADSRSWWTGGKASFDPSTGTITMTGTAKSSDILGTFKACGLGTTAGGSNKYAETLMDYQYYIFD